MTEAFPDDDLLVRTRQLDLAYRRLPLSILLSLTVPVLFVWLMRPLFAQGGAKGGALIWLALVWSASSSRVLLWAWWRRVGFAETNIRHWAVRLWAATTVVGIAWSAGALILMARAGADETLMLAIMVVAVGAIGTTSLGSHLPSAVSFVVAILGPTALSMLASPDLVVRLSGLAVVVATLTLIGTVFRAHRELSQLIRTELRLTAAVADAQHARTVAEEASRAKSTFLANMSHELRTPLNAILGYSEILLEDARTTGARETVADLERVTSAGRHLLALITDVLDLSKIEAGRMDVELNTVDVASIVAQVVETSRTLASAGGNELRVEGLATLGTIRSDAVKLKQVLLNLVGNACKFTSNGRVDVVCRRERRDDVDWVVIAVRDTGIGIAPGQMARLFGQFAQADSSATKRYGGTGLGLAISQRLCQLMGGAISVESSFGLGSTFAMQLPAVVPAVAAGVASVGPQLHASRPAA